MKKSCKAPKQKVSIPPLKGTAKQAARKAKIASQPQQPNRNVFNRSR